MNDKFKAKASFSQEVASFEYVCKKGLSFFSSASASFEILSQPIKLSFCR